MRPALLYPELVGASTLKPEVVSGLDIVIIRELTGDIYFGEPRGRRTNAAGEREGFDTMHYAESEIVRIAEVGFQTALKRNKKLCSVDKENVLETSRLWREVVTGLGKKYPQVELSHMYVDNAAMQLVRAPKQFDVIVTGNMFGDILSDEASMLTGSIGMLPSASLDAGGKGLYEPIHGSAPDIAGKNIANPLGDDTVGSDDAALYVQPGSVGAPHRRRGEKSVGAGLPHGGYIRSWRPKSRNPGNG